MPPPVDVLIVGAGPVGLALACDLKRRGVSLRIIDAAEAGFAGSRAKGLQPRTQEVFDDLGVLDAVQRRSRAYPLLGIHLGPITVPWPMHRHHAVTDDVPYPNTLMVAQADTDACLQRRLEDLGGQVEYSTALASCQSASDSVRAILVGPDGAEEHVKARYLVGADGGGSTVRKELGIGFVGETDEADRMIVADVIVRDFPRNRWHIWPRRGGSFMGLCPLPAPDTYQLMIRLRPNEQADLDLAAIQATARRRSRGSRLAIERVTWASVFRPNVRLAATYRVGNAFLAGDAAHVHTPAGAQGLNTGVQDAYNLGWKLAQALAGGPTTLLDTYEAERRPVAARVLGLTSELYGDISRNPLAAAKRGDGERQLTLTYHGGPLTLESCASIQSGDRAPNAPFTGADGRRSNVFDALRGPHFTLLAVGDQSAPIWAQECWPVHGTPLEIVHVPASGSAQINDIYSLTGPTHLLIRPDGYLAYAASDNFAQTFMRAAATLGPAPAQLRKVEAAR